MDEQPDQHFKPEFNVRVESIRLEHVPWDQGLTLQVTIQLFLSPLVSPVGCRKLEEGGWRRLHDEPLVDVRTGSEGVWRVAFLLRAPGGREGYRFLQTRRESFETIAAAQLQPNNPDDNQPDPKQLVKSD